MQYSIKTLVKAGMASLVAASGAATAAANGPDLSVLTADQWLLVLGAGLTAGVALLHPVGAKPTTNEKAATSISDVAAAAAATHQALTQEAIDSIHKVQEAAGAVTAAAAPQIDSLAARVITATHKAS